MSHTGTSDHLGEIAIVGMAGRFPGARNVNEFWRNIRDGVESVTFFSDEELKSLGVDPAVSGDPRYVRAGAFLSDIDLFDASFFGFTPREAEITDPQHRLFLECSWEALENAGYDPGAYPRRVGVYAGSATNDYFLNIYARPDIAASAGDFQIEIGNNKDHLSQRVSYKLNLKGPSLNIQTGCSTSLVAVHLACQGLLDFECDMALAGGVSIGGLQPAGYLHQEGGILSPDGHCRAFDAAAAGTVGGRGVGVVVLKRLADAIAERDSICAVIKGSAVNNDGSLKVGYPAPGVDGQAEVVAKALALAGVGPEAISYVEAHGTGTPLGDLVEVAALTKCFRAGTRKKGFCAVGSVKTNVGHLNTAAGVAGLIKTALMLKHRTLPPSLHFERANPQIDFDGSPFFVNARLTPWQSEGGARRAGVSSFGIGGTNAHVVVEEAPRAAAQESTRPWHLLVLSARTDAALERATDNLAEYLGRNPGASLPDVAYTLQTGRKAFSRRRAVVCRDVRDASEALRSRPAQRVATGVCEEAEPAVAFLFAGQGAQRVDMAGELYRADAAFRADIDHFSERLASHLGLDVRAALYPPAAQSADAGTRLAQTVMAQAAMFVIQYALARRWAAWGVRPRAMLGHSVGEYVAACLAGVFSLEEAASLIGARGRLMQQLPAGAMLAVPLSEADVSPLLGEGLSLAAVNTPTLCTVSGTPEATDHLERLLARGGTAARRLHTSHAFHSAMMEPIVEEFVREVRKVELREPNIPFVSSVTGTWITAAEATDPRYWGAHLRRPVRFADGVAELLKEPGRLLLEVGPGRTVSTFARQHPARAAGQVVTATLGASPDAESDVPSMLRTLGRLWLAGVSVEWENYHAGERRSRVPLPTYPFERERFWIDGRAAGAGRKKQPPAVHTSDAAGRFYTPLWKQSVPPPAGFEPFTRPEQKPRWLVFDDGGQLGAEVTERLAGEGESVVRVLAGERYAGPSEGAHVIDPRRPGHYERLLEELHGRGQFPTRVVYLWGLSPFEEGGPAAGAHRAAPDAGFSSLLFIARSIDRLGAAAPLRICVVSDRVQSVTGEEPSRPERAAVLGPCQALQGEYPNVTCLSVDLTLVDSDTRHRTSPAGQLLAELGAASHDAVVAYRGGRRWVQSLEPVRLGERGRGGDERLREGGVYLVTGAEEALGLALAEHLAETLRAKLVLVTDAGLPPADEWERWLESPGENDELSRRIRRLEALAARGALVCRADAADAEQMREVLGQARRRFGELDGILHARGGAGASLPRNPETAAGVPYARVEEARLLESLLGGRPGAFLVLFSSLASAAAGPGQAVECAASACLDALAQSRRPEGTVVHIRWELLNDDAGAPPPAEGASQDQSPSRSFRNACGLTPRECAEAFERIMSTPLSRVTVSKGDLQALLDEAGALAAAARAKKGGPDATSDPGPDRRTVPDGYAAPRTAVEQLLVEIWQELFGIEPVGIHDDFIELGGHSLLAIQLVTRVRDTFRIELPLDSLFASPTVAGLAERIVADQLTPEEREEIEQLYREISDLSSEEARERLARELRAEEGGD